MERKQQYFDDLIFIAIRVSFVENRFNPSNLLAIHWYILLNAEDLLDQFLANIVPINYATGESIAVYFRYASYMLRLAEM